MTALALQIGGGVIVLAALLQATVGLVGQVSTTLRNRRMDERRRLAFETQTELLVRRARVERERTELTWAGKRKFRIIERRIENRTGDICSYYLAPHDGGPLPPYLPGQFLTFEVQIPDQPNPVVRCYSLSDTPTNRDHYRVTIKRLSPPVNERSHAPAGLCSSYFHDVLKVGDVLDVNAPSGAFHLDVESDRPVVLIAGGVGLTPVLSMLKWLAAEDSHRETWFFYAARNGADMALRNEIAEIVSSRSHFHSVLLYSAPTAECEADDTFDRKGYLSVEVLKQYLGASNYEFYICGPPPMMESLTSQLLDWGVPEEDIRFEAFGPAAVKKVSREAHEPTAVGTCKVHFARSGKALMWTEDGGTLLDLADANGLRVHAGCRAGNCGSCATAVKEGAVRYLTKPATKPAQGTALLCISQPDGDVVLDA